MAKGTHDTAPDPRNATILISVNGALKPRAEAVVSVFDSGFVLGDGVWEGLRVHKGRIAFLDRASRPAVRGRQGDRHGHRPRPARRWSRRLYETLDANGMTRRRPHPADGHARRPLDALSGPARHRLARDHRHHPRAQGAAAGDGRTGHHACSPSMSAAAIPTCRTRSSTRIPSSTASPPASRRAGRRRRGADARSARLRRHLQLDPFLHRPQGRGLDLDRRLLPRRDHPRQRHRSSAARTASRCSRRTSR